MAFGMGVVRGMAITLRHFFDTYTVGQNKQPSAAGDVPARAEATVAGKIPAGMPTELGGIFTSQYPEQKLPVPERFRYIPFLLYEDDGQGERAAFDGIRCTACGICAKVCPPQCIWIVQGKGDDGRPRPVATEFFIDASICMSCGFCAEYCPFDAIKMDHDYELAAYDRTTHHIYDKKKLSKEFRYWQTIAPNRVWSEAEARGHWEHKDVEKLAKKAGVTLPPPTEENMYRATTVLPEDKKAAPAAGAAPALAAPAAAPAAAPTGLTGDPFVDMANEALPLPFRAKAAVEGRQMIDAKTYKPKPNDRKAIAAVQKLAKDQNTTIEDLAAQATGTPVLQAVPAVAAPAPTAAPAAAPAPVVAAPAADNEIWLAKELETRSKNKEVKLTGDDRKRISRAKAAAAEAGLDWENLPAPGSVQVSVPAPTPAAPAEAAPAPSAAPAPPAAAGGVNEEIQAAKLLETKGKNKEIKLTGEDRKRISAAKKAAQEAGIDWDSL